MKCLQEKVGSSPKWLEELSDHNTNLTPSEREQDVKLNGCVLDHDPVWLDCRGTLVQSPIRGAPSLCLTAPAAPSD